MQSKYLRILVETVPMHMRITLNHLCMWFPQSEIVDAWHAPNTKDYALIHLYAALKDSKFTEKRQRIMAEHLRPRKYGEASTPKQ